MPPGNGDGKSDTEYEEAYEETMRDIVSNLRKKLLLNL
jgi:hypothetical protein